MDQEAVNEGLKYVNNDACYPSILVVGQLMNALKNGNYDLNRVALLISQTGGGCRASNYIGFIRKALKDAGMPQIPVISVSAAGLENNPGFTITPALLNRAMMAMVYGDLFMHLLYRVRPYRTKKGRGQCALREMERDCLPKRGNWKLDHFPQQYQKNGGRVRYHATSGYSKATCWNCG